MRPNHNDESKKDTKPITKEKHNQIRLFSDRSFRFRLDEDDKNDDKILPSVDDDSRVKIETGNGAGNQLVTFKFNFTDRQFHNYTNTQIQNYRITELQNYTITQIWISYTDRQFSQ